MKNSSAYTRFMKKRRLITRPPSSARAVRADGPILLLCTSGMTSHPEPIIFTKA